MKRIAVLLLMAMWLGACADTTTDVVDRGGGGGGDDTIVPPDTTIRDGSFTTNVYGQDNALARQKEAALLLDATIQDRIETLAAYDYVYEPGNTRVLTATAADGRSVTLSIVTLRPTTGTPLAAHVVDLRVGSDRAVRAVRGVENAGAITTETLAEGKRDAGTPELSPLMGKLVNDLMMCLSIVLADVQACLMNCCLESGGSIYTYNSCARVCLQEAFRAFAQCLMLRFSSL